MKFINRLQAAAISIAVLGSVVAATPALAAGAAASRCPVQGPQLPIYRQPTQPTKPVTPVKPAPTQPAQPGTVDKANGMTADEQKILTLVNGERAKAGLKPLQGDADLTKLARAKSQDMVNKRYFSHQSPTYGSPFDQLRSAGISYRTAGENIAGNPSVEGAFKAWMNSSGHRANILSSKYTHIGIGIVKGGPYGMMFTQLFVGR